MSVQEGSPPVAFSTVPYHRAFPHEHVTQTALATYRANPIAVDHDRFRRVHAAL